MGKRNHFCRLLVVVYIEGDIALDGRGILVVSGEVNEPQIGVKVASSGNDGAAGLVHCYLGISEGCCASGIAKLANGEGRRCLAQRRGVQRMPSVGVVGC